jgi:hypothetical protein
MKSMALPNGRKRLFRLNRIARVIGIAVLGSLFKISSACADDLAIRGLSVGQDFDTEQLRSLLDRMECTGDLVCRGYLSVLNLLALTEVDGKNGKISKIQLTLSGAQYPYVLSAYTGKYGKPLLLPDKMTKIGSNSIVESGIAEWRSTHRVLRLSRDEKLQLATLTLSARSP